MGLRYDYQGMACPPIKNPDTLLGSFNIDTSTCPKDKNNFAPRFGLSYAFNERTVLRAGFGIFYNRTPAIVVGTAHSQNGIQVTGINITCATPPPGVTCPTYPTIFSAPPAASPANPNLFVFARDYVQPYVEQGRVGFERQLSRNLSFSATYLYYHGLHLTRTRDINLQAPAPFARTGPDGITYTFLRFSSTRPTTWRGQPDSNTTGSVSSRARHAHSTTVLHSR
jgi:hypothetical protein